MTDVVVIGGGIVGAAVARELAVRGVGVTLLERGAIAGGSTGLGEGNVLCSDKDAGPELELVRAGLALYGELAERLGEEARIRVKGALIVHPGEMTWAAEPARLERLGIAGARLVAADEVRVLEPELTGELHGASHFPGDLQCDPRAITRALVREARQAGAEIREGCAVEAVFSGGVRIAGGETVNAGAVVIAAGSWSAALSASAGLELPLEPRKGQLVQLSAPQPRLVKHKVVDGSYLRSVASADAGLELATVVETTWEGDVLVGSTRERRGFDTTVDPALSDALVARAARLFPRLAQLPVAAAWAGLRPWLPDRLPAIGPSALVGGLWLATGHEGAGVALGPVTGRLVAQLYAGEAPVVDPAPFDPDRFSRREAARTAGRARRRRALRRSRPDRDL